MLKLSNSFFLKRKLRISIRPLFKGSNTRKGNKERKESVPVLLDLLLLL